MADEQARLVPVDGLRGLAAAMVVVSHVHQQAGSPQLGVISPVLAKLGIGVQLFFVISGFCLFYPLTKPGVSPAWGRFYRRRARRILPPYYAALSCVVVLPFMLAPLAHYAGLVIPRGPVWPGFEQLWSRILLVHTFSPRTMFTLDRPFWTLGVEAQFYLAFPLAVWLCRRYGWRGLGIIAAVTILYRIGLYVSAHRQQDASFLTSGNGSLDVKANLFLGTWLQFGLGMLMAMVVRQKPLLQVGRTVELTVLLLVAALEVAGVWFGQSAPDRWLLPVGDTLIAAGWSILLLTACTRGTITSGLCGHPWLVALGAVSYSLYLIHDPILIALAPSVLAMHLNGAGSTLVLALCGVPLVAACTLAFFRLFERPFLQHKR